jgi:NADH-quinone oxidoreductase subunit H
MAEYGSMMAVAVLAAILFLGGWNGPLPVSSWLGLTFDNGPVLGYLGNLLGCVNVILKGVIGVTLMMWVRWTLPRLRIDQVITTCLKYCVPIAAVCFLGATWWQFMWPNGLLVPTEITVYQLRENWPEAPAETIPPATVAANLERGAI